jgi:hypothetical protein
MNDYVYVVATSEFETTVNLSIPHRGYDETRKIARGENAIFELTPEEAQLYPKSGYDLTRSNFQKENGGIILTSEKPVSAKVLIDYRDSQEGFLLYPTSVMGTKYSVSSFNDGSGLYPNYISFPGYAAIISLYDDNIIRFKFNGNGNAGGISKGGESIKQIDKGDVWIVASQGVESDLSGSIIESDHPIVVISACQSTNIPVNNKWHNYIVEQEIPMRFWGQKYHVAALKNRDYPPVLRIFGDVETYDSTVVQVYYENDENSTVKIDTLILSKETCKYSSNFIEYRPKGRYVTLKSENRFSVSYFNTGVEEDGMPQPKGSPFQMNLTSIENYAEGAVFSVDRALDKENTDKYYMQVFLKNYKQQEQEIRIGTFTDGEVNYSDMFDENIRDFQIMPDENGGSDAYLLIELKRYGTYLIDSECEFAAYMYVLKKREAIGYQAVMSMSNLHSADKYKPHVSVVEECPGQIDGSVCDMPDDDVKRSNLSTVIFEDMENFERIYIDPITAGETRCADWSLRVKNPYKKAYAHVLFRDLVGNDTVCKFVYNPPSIDMNPKYENYGSAAINQEVKKEFTIVNDSDSAIFNLNSIKLKSENSYFYIAGDTPDKMLMPGEEFKFEIGFESPDGGFFIDSVGIGNSCFFKYFSKVEAVIGEPRIDALDANFSAVEVGKKAQRTVSIINKGVSNLIIDDWEQIGDDVFTPIFKQDISKTNPVIIVPNGSFEFEVACNPLNEKEYFGEIVFSSNAKTIDSVTTLSAIGVTVGIVAESYDYLKKRINPISPYPIENETGGIKIRNISKTHVTVNDISEINSENGNAFKFDRNDLSNRTIVAEGEHVYPVFFSPDDVGEYELTYSYEVEGQDELKAETNLKGIGIAPKIEVNDVDFGTVIQSGEIITKTITIYNHSEIEWQWADSCQIHNIRDSENGSISFNPWVFGTQNFSINKNSINFKKWIQPGESVSINVDFLPEVEGVFEAYLEIISDSYNELDPVKITAKVVSNDVLFVGGETEVCKWESSIISGKIYNNTKSDVEFLGLAKSNDLENSDFRIVNSDFESDFIVAAEEEIEIALEYTSPGEMNQSITLALEDKSGIYTRTASFFGNTKKNNQDISISPVARKVVPGELYDFAIELDAEEDLEEFTMSELEIEIFYEPGMININQNNISLVSELNGKFDYIIEKMQKNVGYIKIKLFSITDEYFNKSGKLLNVTYETFLPTRYNETSEVVVTIQSPSTTCVEFEEAHKIIAYDDYCAAEYRSIVYSPIFSENLNVTPNPIKQNAEIEFSVIFDSEISIKLYDVKGVECLTMVDGEYKSGKHKIDYDFNDVDSGVYILIMKSPYGNTYKKIQLLK